MSCTTPTPSSSILPNQMACTLPLLVRAVANSTYFQIHLVLKATLFFADGDKIFDWAGQFGSHLLGYNHKELQSPEVCVGFSQSQTVQTAF